MSAFAICRTAVLIVCMAGGCSRDGSAGPPDIVLGRDVCGECGMVIGEDRFSAAMLVERGGHRESVLFDDIGCLLDYRNESEHADAIREVRSFVRDYARGRWIAGGEAWYLFADRGKLATPMGTGMAAFATEEGARRAQREYGGRIMRLAELAEARKKWLEVLYGTRENG